MTQLTTVRLIIIFLIPWLLLLAGCDDREWLPDRWRGIPSGVSVRCEWERGVGICIGGGMAYQCLKLGTEGNVTHRWSAFECARVSAAVLPERKDEE